MNASDFSVITPTAPNGPCSAPLLSGASSSDSAAEQALVTQPSSGLLFGLSHAHLFFGFIVLLVAVIFSRSGRN
jgi:hypothetical protein